VERKHQEPTKAPAIARCVFATNSLPQFADRSNGIWDRIRIIPFETRFRGTDKQNPHLKHEIVERELPGIFTWAVTGLGMLLKQKRFPILDAGQKIAQQHRRDCDHEEEFLSEYYHAVEGCYTPKSEMYASYREFCKEHGYRPKSSAHFHAEVRRLFPEAYDLRERVTDGNIWIWRGIARRSRVA